MNTPLVSATFLTLLEMSNCM